MKHGLVTRSPTQRVAPCFAFKNIFQFFFLKVWPPLNFSKTKMKDCDTGNTSPFGIPLPLGKKSFARGAFPEPRERVGRARSAAAFPFRLWSVVTFFNNRCPETLHAPMHASVQIAPAGYHGSVGRILAIRGRSLRSRGSGDVCEARGCQGWSCWANLCTPEPQTFPREAMCPRTGADVRIWHRQF